MTKVTYDIREITDDIKSWLDEVYPERGVESTIAKLQEELNEISEKPLDAWEMADLLIVLFDFCDILGFDIAKIVKHKMDINKERNWAITGGVFKHVPEQSGVARYLEGSVRPAVGRSADPQESVSSGTHVQRSDDSQGHV